MATYFRLGEKLLQLKRERAIFATWRDRVTDPIARISHRSAVLRLTAQINHLAKHGHGL